MFLLEYVECATFVRERERERNNHQPSNRRRQMYSLRGPFPTDSFSKVGGLSRDGRGKREEKEEANDPSQSVVVVR